MNIIRVMICVGTLMTVAISEPFTTVEDTNDVDMGIRLKILFQQNKYEEIKQLVEERYTCLTKNGGVNDIDALVSIGETAIVEAPKNNHAYSIFFDVLKKLIDYSPDDPDTRLLVYHSQSRLVAKLLAQRYVIEQSSEQIRQQAKGILVVFLKNIDSRIIPDYQPRKAYLNVPPPVVTSTNERIGFNPSAVKDPLLRQEWEKKIEDNYINTMLNKEQKILVRLKSEYEPQISFFGKEQ